MGVFLMCASASFLPAGGGEGAPALVIAVSFKVATFISKASADLHLRSIPRLSDVSFNCSIGFFPP